MSDTLKCTLTSNAALGFGLFGSVFLISYVGFRSPADLQKVRGRLNSSRVVAFGHPAW